MRPSETTDGKAWLANFDPADQALAELLVDSLEIHDYVEIMSTLASQLKRFANSNPSGLPATLVPIRSFEDLVALGPTPVVEHVAYKTFNPGAVYPALPGSEADVGAMFRGLLDNSDGAFLSPDTGLKKLKELKARTICLVADYSGSGTQAMRFAKAFRANTTIASWLSFGLLKLRVITYAANLQASRLLGDEPYLDFETHTVAKSALSADWSPEQRQGILSLCERYANPADDHPPLGYHDSFGLYLNNMRVPNNLPQILIRDSGPFPGLFPNRQVPASFHVELRSYVPLPSLVRTLRNLGELDLASRLELETRPVHALRALAALQLLNSGLPNDKVWALLGLGESDQRALRTSLIALECITLDGKLTARGKSELRRAGRRRATQSRHIHEPRPPVVYEPTQLR